MSAKKLLKNNRGVALIITIMIISLMVPMSLRFITSTFFYRVSAANLSNGIKADTAARSGIEYALAILFEDGLSSEVDSLHDSWANSEALTSDSKALFDEAEVGIEISDISGKININRLVMRGGAEKENRFDDIQKKILIRFLKATDLDLEDEEVENIINSIKDWIDPDDEVTEEGGVGAESTYYKGLSRPYACRNAPMKTIEELRLIKGITGPVFSEMAKYFTVYGDEKGKININTAPKIVLKALSDDIYDEEADTLVNYREETDNDKLADRFWYQKALNTQENLIYPDLITTMSAYFGVISTGSMGAMKKKIQCIVEREEKTLKVLSWKIEDE